MGDDVAFYLLINAGGAHSAESLFGAINGNDPGAIVPISELYRAIGDDGVVLKILSPDLNQFLTHHRLTADPRTEHHRMTGRLHLFKLLHPLFDRELLLVVVIFREK